MNSLYRNRLYAKTPPECPSIADKAIVNNHSCVWSCCSECGKERWVRAKRGGVPEYSSCVSCSRTIKREKLRIANCSRAAKLRWGDKEYREKALQKLAEGHKRYIAGYQEVESIPIQQLKSNDSGEIGDIERIKNGSFAEKIRCEHCGVAFWIRLPARNKRCKSCAGKLMRIEHRGVFDEAQIKWMDAMRRSLHIKPNKTELRLLEILDMEYPRDWKYVGDWSFVIADKNPEFVNVNGKKQIIELFGDYWHRNDNPDERIALFKKYGYDTLIIWESEMANTIELKKKIKAFVG